MAVFFEKIAMRLIIVSNRLPFTVENKGGVLEFTESAGGLVSGISSYLDSLKNSSFSKNEYVWVGWPGITLPETLKGELKKKAYSEFRSYPVFLAEDAMGAFYHGFCNKTIWPLFHYFPSYAVYDPEYWEQYKKVNSDFCDAVAEIIRPGDVVWVHDYHLMLLPGLLRKKFSDANIGFFLHIPFPSFEIFRLLPNKWRQEILTGLLGADLVGFHTHDYTQYFLRCVLRLLGYEHTLGRLIVEGRIVRADTFPMGIDYDKFHGAPASPGVAAERETLLNTLGSYKVVLSVDRLDYSKGIINRIEAFNIFLEKNPPWHGKITLLLVVVPSRIGVEHYQNLKEQIDKSIGKINGKFGSINWTPIIYQYKYFSFNQLVALYTISDIALITPLRDGMNLIAKEYIASRTDKTGVLILSEMAGASKELGEAIIINPNNREEIAEAIMAAIEMPPEEQKHRNSIMQARIGRYDVVKWADDFFNKLQMTKEEQEKFGTSVLSPALKKQLRDNFNAAGSRLLFLDYDGTLVPFTPDPLAAKPSKELLEILKNFGEIPRTELVLISGRTKDTLQAWFGALNICLVAEHGVWLKEHGGQWQLIKTLMNEWKPKIFPILEAYMDRLPGSFIEEKEFSIALHYRKADAELSSIRIKELRDDLVNFTANIDVQILQGSRVIEVRSAGANKGTAALHWTSRETYDFILAVGDDMTDEDLFKALPENSYTIKVGLAQSNAKYCLYNYAGTVDLLKEIVK
ncbi:MAG: bifunctional alpha,alpha-trehalose-phosphate synthase (UDP-forming)/trehalose-phosphatase [Elusimicrobiota bacterium]